MTRISTTPALPLLPLIALLGCGGGSPPPVAPAAPPVASSPFPTADQLARLAAGAAPALTTELVDVPTWELAGPFPTRIEVTAAAEVAPWSGLFGDAVQRGTLTMTGAMQCVARETGRFFLEHGAQPADGLRRAIEGWCGTTTDHVAVLVSSGDVPAEVPEDELFASWSKDSRLVEAVTEGGVAQAGIWFGRSAGRAVLAVARAVPSVVVEPTELAPPADGVVVLRGTLVEPAERIRVLVNRGALAVAECTLDPAIALPAFEARCAVDAADATAWIEISADPPGRILGEVRWSALVRRPDAPHAYALAGLPADDAAGGGDLASLTHRVNRARQLGGLSPLVIADAQGTTAAALAPHFFAARLTGDASNLTDRIALGLMAGWDVPAQVGDAGFYATGGAVADASQLVATALDSPLGRWALLDARATHLAVGGVRDPASGVSGALFLTYRTLPTDTAAATRAVVDAIAAARTERGLPPLRLLDATADRVARIVDEVRTGATSPSDAMTSLLAHASRTSGASLGGWLNDTSDLSDLTLADGAFGAGPAMVVVAPYRAAGQPWWRWAVFVVAPPP